jgi:hypothetical protein
MSPRELDALRRQFVAEQKQADSASKWQLANDIVSGINDIVGRGVIAPILGMPGDINQAIYDAGAFVNNKIKDVEVATGMVKQPRYVQPTQGNAYLGSEDIGNRMQQAGLVSSERRPMTELAASLVSPSAVAKTAINAPKTAMNMLRMADNLEAPSRGIRNADGMYIPRSQMGAIDVWHGSPHKFERFTAMDNIGGGEGAQAYGYGGYHASNPDVAVGYKNTLSKDTFLSPTGAVFSKNRLIDLGFDKSDAAIIMAAIKNSGGDFNEAAKLVNRPSVAKFLIGIGDGGSLNEGSLYRNQLRWPDAAREASDPLSDKHFLDWDKPLSEQKDVIGSITPESMGLQYRQLDNGKHAYVNAEGGVVGNIQSGGTPESFRENWTRQLIREPDTGADFYKNLSSGLFSGDKGSVALRQAGIPGIRYLDAGSRPTNVVDKELYALYEKYGDVEKAVDEMMKGVYNTPKVKQQMREGYIKQLNEQKQTHNYVTFSDDLVNILERNGVPVTAPQPGLKK